MIIDQSDLILQYFSYLITEFNCSVEEKKFDTMAMGNAIVRFLSPLIGIEVVIDRDQVLIALGDRGEPREKWFDYSFVLEYFGASEAAYSDIGQLFDEKRPNHPSNADTWAEVIETQLGRLAFVFRQYCEPILKGDLSMKTVMNEVKERRWNEMLKRLDKLDYTSTD